MRITDKEVSHSGNRLSLMVRIDLGPIEEAELPDIAELSPETRAEIEAAISYEQAEHWSEVSLVADGERMRGVA